MGVVKDLVDLVAKLNDSVQDRKFAAELREIQGMIGSIQSEHAELHEQRISLMTENAELKQEIASLQQKIVELKQTPSKAPNALDHGTEQVLLLFYKSARELPTSAIASSFSLDRSKAQYYLDLLRERNLIFETRSEGENWDGIQEAMFEIAPEGRAYVVENMDT